MTTPKVFGIGFHKTGTSSLAQALSKLGYKMCNAVGVHDPQASVNAIPLAIKTAQSFDTFRGNPWSFQFRVFDDEFPGSKFILTMRDPDGWISSAVRHFGRKTTPMREWIYGAGSPYGNEDLYRERYERHTREVLEYFRDRPGDLLVMNIIKGDGWNVLCPFLDKAKPDIPFPHANEASAREQRKRQNA